MILSSDYSKTAHLQEDRSIEFHTPQGCHYSLRIPRYGRDLAYNKAAAELLVPAAGVNSNGLGGVFRINLEQGRFMQEYEVEVGGDDFTSSGGGALQGGINAGSVNVAAIAEESHNLMAFGTSIGTVEYWDSRSRSRAAVLGVPLTKRWREYVPRLPLWTSTDRGSRQRLGRLPEWSTSMTFALQFRSCGKIMATDIPSRKCNS